VRVEGAPEVGTKLAVHLTGDGGHGISFKPRLLHRTSAIVGSTQLLEQSSPNFGDSTDMCAG
jgi:hypothetical protein